MLKRRIKKLTNAMFKKASGRKFLFCGVCGEEEVEVSLDTKNVTCAYCVQRMIEPPPNYEKKEKSDKPRGWHFKAYFEHNGVVYSKGVEITDIEEIAKLKKEAGVTDSPKSKRTVKKTAKSKTKSKRGNKHARVAR